MLFMGLLCLRGNTIQEVGIEMAMSCSIHWVAVIDGSLYSRFYGMVPHYTFLPFGSKVVHKISNHLVKQYCSSSP